MTARLRVDLTLYEGQRYVDGSGWVTPPLVRDPVARTFVFWCRVSEPGVAPDLRRFTRCYTADGRHSLSGSPHPLDLVRVAREDEE